MSNAPIERVGVDGYAQFNPRVQMTNPIDTTKAPKGATHYLLRDGHPQWRKNADNRWYAWSSCWAVWVVISGEAGLMWPSQGRW